MSVAVGDQLQATTGSWTNAPTLFAYQWQDCSNPDGVTGAANISGATRSDYVVAGGETGKYLSCLVTATNLAGDSAQQRSEVVGPVEALLTGVWGIAR